MQEFLLLSLHLCQKWRMFVGREQLPLPLLLLSVVHVMFVLFKNFDMLPCWFVASCLVVFAFSIVGVRAAGFHAVTAHKVILEGCV